MQKIKFLGASGGVTGSSYLLTDDKGSSILVDLGMFQGEDDINDINLKPLPFDVPTLTAVFITHAHLDHCGRLPILVKQGFKGKIYTTKASTDIIKIALLDAAVIAWEKPGALIYTKEEVEEICSKIIPVEYDSLINLGDFSATFRDAGHILGSSSIEITTSSNDTFVFSGDLGNTPEDLIKPTEYIKKGNFIVMESTYGDAPHPKEDVLDILKQEILEIEKTNGVLLIPAFSIERSQEILHRLGHMRKNNLINASIPIFLDSPMAIEVTEVFKKYPNLYNSELASDQNPFDFQNLIFTRTSDESKEILKQKGPKIIIAGSGMMSGGRILHHLENYISDSSTRILFVGYQAIGTLGRVILNGAKHINLNKKNLTVAAAITDLKSLSSHADQPKLINWLKSIQGIKKVFLVHGDDKKRIILSEKIKTELNIQDIVLPKIGEEFEI